MKKAFFISAILFSPSVYGQGDDIDLQISRLLKFDATQENVCSVLNKEDSDLSILYENGISAYIRYTAHEGEHGKVHSLTITYFIPKMNLFVENKNDRKEILNFIKQKLDKNGFILGFFDEAYEIALNYFDESLKEEADGFSVLAVNPDWASELLIRVRKIQDSRYDNQYVVSIYYWISL